MRHQGGVARWDKRGKGEKTKHARQISNESKERRANSVERCGGKGMLSNKENGCKGEPRRSSERVEWKDQVAGAEVARSELRR